MPKRYWLIKSEPHVYGIDRLEEDGETGWTGVRNYQARNNMRDLMQVGDGVLYYHSSCDTPAIVGLAEVSRAAHPDPTQFDTNYEYYDPTSKFETPTWMMVGVRFVKKLKQPLTLDDVKKIPELKKMVLLNNSRLSVQPVSAEEWEIIIGLTAKGR